MFKKILNKKAVSMMISYVILVSIVLGLSIGVYAWLEIISKDIEPEIDCKEGTSLILEDYECDSHQFLVTVKNNGRFNIDGFIISIAQNTGDIPTIYPFRSDSGTNPDLPGHYTFENPLKPGESFTAKFINKGKNLANNITAIREFRLQSYINYKNDIIMCQNSRTNGEIENCEFD